MSSNNATITKAQIVLFAIFIASAAFAIDMLIPGLPSLAKTLGIDNAKAGGLLSIFFISFAIGQLVVGPISDRVGRRPLALAGLVVLIISSTVAIFSESYNAIVAVRVFQALGICSLTVIARASVSDLLGTQDTAKVFALLMLVGGVAPMVAPWMGTFLTNSFGWQGIFGALVIIAIVLLVLSYFHLPETHKRSSEFKENTFVSYWKLLSNTKILMYLLTGAFSGGILFTFIGSISTVLREVYQLDQGSFATVFTLHALSLVLGSQMSRMVLANKEPKDALMISSLVIAVMGVLMVVAGIVLDLPLTIILALQYIIGLNFVTIQANGLALAISDDENRAGAGAALFGAGGFALGSIMSSLANGLFDGSNTYYILVIAGNGIAILLCTLIANKLQPTASAS